jgi:hypothetical protein
MAHPLVEAWRRFSLLPGVRPLTERRVTLTWKLSGRPIPPPPIVKYGVIKEYQRRFGLRTLIETGTFAGGTIDALEGRFDRIVSIELSPDWHARAVARFASLRHVTLVHGDSATRLPEVLQTLREPALFWLDAHYSGPITARGAIDSPIVRELEAIRAHGISGHVILIDDMRDFQGGDGYPAVAELLDWIRAADPGADVEVRDDILRWVTVRTR